jgi:hypothetical protein
LLQVNVEQLRGMASEPSSDFVFEVTDFQALASIKSELVIKTCKGKVQTNLKFFRMGLNYM